MQIKVEWEPDDIEPGIVFIEHDGSAAMIVMDHVTEREGFAYGSLFGAVDGHGNLFFMGSTAAELAKVLTNEDCAPEFLQCVGESDEDEGDFYLEESHRVA